MAEPTLDLGAKYQWRIQDLKKRGAYPHDFLVDFDNFGGLFKVFAEI